MRERVPSARTRGVAHLRRHRLILNKAGRDGTAKANVTPDGESSVWGAVYELHAEGLRAIVDKQSIERAILNLVNNAFNALEQRETGVKQITIATGEEGTELFFSIQDTGMGIAPEIESHILDT